MADAIDAHTDELKRLLTAEQDAGRRGDGDLRRDLLAPCGSTRSCT
jgi:hypothetical protein